jgi:hypothetical protein
MEQEHQEYSRGEFENEGHDRIEEMRRDSEDARKEEVETIDVGDSDHHAYRVIISRISS